MYVYIEVEPLSFKLDSKSDHWWSLYDMEGCVSHHFNVSNVLSHYIVS